MNNKVKLNFSKVGTSVVSALAIGMIIKAEKAADHRLELKFNTKNQKNS